MWGLLPEGVNSGRFVVSLGVETHTVFRQPLPLRGFDEEVRCGGCGWRCEQRAGGGAYLYS